MKSRRRFHRISGGWKEDEALRIARSLREPKGGRSWADRTEFEDPSSANAPADEGASPFVLLEPDSVP
jgi:hypothetical protein